VAYVLLGTCHTVCAALLSGLLSGPTASDFCAPPTEWAGFGRRWSVFLSARLACCPCCCRCACCRSHEALWPTSSIATSGSDRSGCARLVAQSSAVATRPARRQRKPSASRQQTDLFSLLSLFPPRSRIPSARVRAGWVASYRGGASARPRRRRRSRPINQRPVVRAAERARALVDRAWRRRLSLCLVVVWSCARSPFALVSAQSSAAIN
jgi:hypothetical protein